MAMTMQAMPAGREATSSLPAPRTGRYPSPLLQRHVDGSSRQMAQQRQMMQWQKASTRPAMDGDGTIQCKTYAKTVKKPVDFDVNQWPASLSQGGGEANSKIAANVNKTLAALGWSWRCMSAHMIPKRLGGLGNESNVRPWSEGFERGDWEQQMEQGFNQEMEDSNVGDEVSYKVETQDMDDGAADKIVKPLTGDKSVHKERIKKIPLGVKGEVNGEEKINSTACFPGAGSVGLGAIGGLGVLAGAAAGAFLGGAVAAPIAAGALLGGAVLGGLGWLAGY